MAQPTFGGANGVSSPEHDDNAHLVAAIKRKRDVEGDDEMVLDQDDVKSVNILVSTTKDDGKLIQYFLGALEP